MAFGRDPLASAAPALAPRRGVMGDGADRRHSANQLDWLLVAADVLPSGFHPVSSAAFPATRAPCALVPESKNSTVRRQEPGPGRSPGAPGTWFPRSRARNGATRAHGSLRTKGKAAHAIRDTRASEASCASRLRSARGCSPSERRVSIISHSGTIPPVLSAARPQETLHLEFRDRRLPNCASTSSPHEPAGVRTNQEGGSTRGNDCRAPAPHLVLDGVAELIGLEAGRGQDVEIPALLPGPVIRWMMSRFPSRSCAREFRTKLRLSMDETHWRAAAQPRVSMVDGRWFSAGNPLLPSAKSGGIMPE